MLLYLVDFPERKGKIEDANKIVVQNFYSQLTENMGLLHRTVSISVSQQESQLKSLEEGMQSFVSSKGKVGKKLNM
jgi:kinesin family member 11